SKCLLLSSGVSAATLQARGDSIFVSAEAPFFSAAAVPCEERNDRLTPLTNRKAAAPTGTVLIVSPPFHRRQSSADSSGIGANSAERDRIRLKGGPAGHEGRQASGDDTGHEAGETHRPRRNAAESGGERQGDGGSEPERLPVAGAAAQTQDHARDDPAERAEPGAPGEQQVAQIGIDDAEHGGEETR